MKYVKMLGLAAVAAMALMAFVGAGTASATTLDCGTSPETVTCPVGTIIDFSLQSGTSANLVDTEGETLDKCSTSTVKGKVTNAGSATTTVTGNNEEITWTSCTFPTKTTVLGKLEIHTTTEGVHNGNGLLTADSEIGVTINTIFFGSCIYGVTAGTPLGHLTGGHPAVFHADAVAEKLSGSNLACPSTSKWTATYVSTSPTALEVT